MSARRGRDYARTSNVGESVAAPDVARSPLFPPTDERLRVDDALTRALAAADGRVRQGPVANAVDVARLTAEMARFDFAAPVPFDDVLAWTIDWMEHGLVHVTHPRYFGLFNPAPTFPAQCADRIAAVFNPQLATVTTSPFPVRLEAHVIDAVAARIGMPACATGHFTSGGSEANYTAMMCALTQANENFARLGARAFGGAPVCYVSKEAHLAWLKIAHQAGIGRDAVRLVGTDGCGRMDPALLANEIASDCAAGCVPVLVVATAGTTGGGMIDPLAECAEAAARCGAWFHVDAAWGGAAVASDRLRPLLAGIEHAASITIDAHKWFATTMASGMFLTSRPQALTNSFHVTMECMPSNIASLDPYVTTSQWSRRFIGLRLFLSLAAAGWEGYATHVERSVSLCDLLCERLERLDWTRANASPLGVACLLPPPGSRSAQDIARTVLQSGAAWVSAVTFEGQTTIRACVTSGESTQQDMEELVTALTMASGRDS